jgi:hypothetical protein
MDLLKFIFPKTKTVSLRPGDKGFTFSDGISITPRASIEISKNCPPHIKDQILYYHQLGYITVTAHMTEQEHLMTSLSTGD